MFGPAIDSLSDHLESKASFNCSVDCLRWCWKSYLEFDERVKSFVDNASSLKELMAGISTRGAWEQCKWTNTEARRLIEPSVDLPTGLDKQEAPKIFLITNTADPLHECIRACWSLCHAYRMSWRSCYWYVVDSSFKTNAIVRWSDAVFKSTCLQSAVSLHVIVSFQTRPKAHSSLAILLYKLDDDNLVMPNSSSSWPFKLRPQDLVARQVLCVHIS